MKKTMVLICLLVLAIAGCTNAIPEVEAIFPKASTSPPTFSGNTNVNIVVQSNNAPVSIAGECNSSYEDIEWSWNGGAMWKSVSEASAASLAMDCTNGTFVISISDISSYAVLIATGDVAEVLIRGIISSIASEASKAIIVLQNPPTKLLLTGGTSVLSGECVPLQVSALDINNDPQLVTQDIVINLTAGSTTGNFYSANDCTSIPQGNFYIFAGNSFVDVYFKNTTAENLVLTADDANGLLASDSHSIDTYANRFYVSAPAPMLTGTCHPITIYAKDVDGNVASVMGSVTVNLTGNTSGDFWGVGDSSCNGVGGPITNLTFNSSSSETIYFKSNAGANMTLWVSDTAGKMLDGSAAVYLGPDHLDLLGSFSAIAGECKAFTVYLKDATNSSWASDTDTTISLSHGGGGIYSDSNCGTGAPNATITAGNSSKTLYFKSNAAGTFLITVDDISPAVMVSDSRNFEVGPDRLFISGPVNVNSNGCDSFTVYAKDALGSFANVLSDITVNLSGDGSFYNTSDASCTGSGSTTTVTISGGSNSASFLYKRIPTGNANFVAADNAAILTSDNVNVNVIAPCAGSALYNSVGDGSPGTPYLLCEPDQIIDLVTNGCGATNAIDCDKNFIVTANIDLNGISMNPISNFTNCFSGNFDGQGYTIGNVIINPAGSASGFFARVCGGTVTNLRLDSITVSGTSNTGAAIGATYSSANIENVHVEGASSVTCSSNNCGGFVGYAYQATFDKNSTAASVTSSGGKVGGFAGYAATAIISNSIARGVVSASTGDLIGGFVGHAFGDSNILTSWSSGAVNGFTNVGGFAGKLENSSVSDSFARGNVSGTSNVGTFLGQYNRSTSRSVIRNYSSGTLNCSTVCGGFVGILSNGFQLDFSRNYWNTDTSGKPNADNYGYVVSGQADGLTDMLMRSQASFISYDFITLPVWEINDGVSYPTLWGLPVPQ